MIVPEKKLFDLSMTEGLEFNHGGHGGGAEDAAKMMAANRRIVEELDL